MDVRKLFAGKGNRFVHRLLTAGVADGGCGDDGTAEKFSQLFEVDFISASGQVIEHIKGDNDRDAEFSELSGQVQIPFDICGIDDVDYDVRLFGDEVVAGNDLFKRVR